MNRKIVIAHPLQQHSYRTAEALDEAEILEKYLTTVYYNKDKIAYRLLNKILKKTNIKRMEGRKNPTIDKYIKTYNSWLGLLYLLIIRIDKYKILEPKVYELLIKRFGKNVYKYIKHNNENALIMYDKTAYQCFKLLKNNNYMRILDMSSAAAPYVRKILLKELEEGKQEYKKSLKEKMKSYTQKSYKNYRQELKDTDYFLVPSGFVKKSLLYCGIEEEKILLVPYGVDLDMFKQKEYKALTKEDKINFSFVGRAEAAKGFYYLIKAFKELKDLNVTLNVVGGIPDKDREILKDIEEMKNVVYHGIKTKSEMNEIYKKSDVYIMPSLYEGFSLTLFESMASGLPVIATKNTGAEGVINDFKEGFVIDSASTKQLKEKILWFYNNRDKIPEMGKNARKLAERFTWENYKKNLVEKLKNIQY